MQLKTPLVLLALILTGALSISCYWDQETIAMERQKFPDALELISGKFLRHSPAYYYWVVKDGERALDQFPDSLALYDNVAVAYSKLGEDEAAISLMLRKDKLSPGLYETEANLGTFYVHAGQFAKGLEHIKKAIEINPEAHFGREVYQQYLVEYVMGKVEDGKITLPIGKLRANSGPPSIEDETNFNTFILKKYNEKNGTNEKHIPLEERQRAVKGILGMMRFGNHDSPILLEALGDLMTSWRRELDSKYLAVMAYLKAAHEAEDEKAKQGYKARAARLLSFLQVRSTSKYIGLELDEAERQLNTMLLEADKLKSSITNQEKQWILAGLNPVVEFQKAFFKAPKVLGVETNGRHGHPDVNGLQAILKATGNKQGIDSIRNTFVPIDSTMRSFIDSLFYAAPEPLPADSLEAETATESGLVLADEDDEESQAIWVWVLFGVAVVLGGALVYLRRKREG